MGWAEYGAAKYEFECVYYNNCINDDIDDC
jgi:hypothetical protein